AGAWLQPKGDGLFILQKSYYTTDKYFDRNGDMQTQPRFTKWETQPYLEYGVLNNLTVGGTFYAQHVHQSSHDKLGIADPELFVRVGLYDDGTQLISLQPLLKLKSQYRNQTLPRGGSSSTDEELSLFYGRNTNWVSAH